jgi:hypothetical protein
VGVERGDRDFALARFLEHTEQRAGLDRVDHDRIGLAADTVLDLGDLSTGIRLRIEHDQLVTELLGGFLAAGDAALEIGDLQAERDEADRLRRRYRRRQAHGEPEQPDRRQPAPLRHLSHSPRDVLINFTWSLAQGLRRCKREFGMNRALWPCSGARSGFR